MASLVRGTPMRQKLSVEEYERKLQNSDIAYEYWYGEAIPKAMPNWIHSFLQIWIGYLLWQAGYLPGSEVDLRIDPDVIPRPDLIATRGPIENPYPTKAVEVVVEILSPGDDMSYLLDKFRSFHRWGFSMIYLVDPQSRIAYQWTERALEEAETLAGIDVSLIWRELDKALSRPQ